MKPSVNVGGITQDPSLPDCVETPGTVSAFLPRRMPAVQGPGRISSQDEIAALQVRIAVAEAERDAWRGSGMQERYLEAYSMVEALELQLELLRRAVRPRL